MVPPGAGTDTGWPFMVIELIVVVTRARTGLRSMPRIRTALSTPLMTRPAAGTPLELFAVSKKPDKEKAAS